MGDFDEVLADTPQEWISALEWAEADLASLPSPRPYPGLASSGRRWIKSGRYWITYSADGPPIILGVFYETANIPQRLRADETNNSLSH